MSIEDALKEIDECIQILKADRLQEEIEAESDADLLTIEAYNGKIDGMLEAKEIIKSYVNDDN